MTICPNFQSFIEFSCKHFSVFTENSEWKFKLQFPDLVPGFELDFRLNAKKKNILQIFILAKQFRNTWMNCLIELTDLDYIL